MTWTYEESEYQFKLPIIVGNMHSLNKTLTYDATCLEIFETSFDDYIHHRSFTAELETLNGSPSGEE